MTIVVEFSSRLNTPAADVWAVASTMTGINDELAPWVRIRVPARWRTLTLADENLPMQFEGWLVALRLVPFDRHHFNISRIDSSEDEYGFDERSASILQRVWIHRRRITAVGRDACVVVDQLEVEPRVRSAERLVRIVVVLIFRHRHRVLRSRFV